MTISTIQEETPPEAVVISRLEKLKLFISKTIDTIIEKIKLICSIIHRKFSK